MAKPGRKKGYKHTQETKDKIKFSNENSLISSLFEKGHKPFKVEKEKNGRWNGGTSSKGYSVDWTKTLRISIRERDNYTCMKCTEKQGDYSFDIHHIDYDKKNCNPNNLITLCRSCHVKTNGNRKYWLNYFSLLLSNQ